MVLKTHLEPFREHLKVPPVGQQKNPFFLRVYNTIYLFIYSWFIKNQDSQPMAELLTILHVWITTMHTYKYKIQIHKQII